MFNRSFLRRRKVSKLPQSFIQYSSGAAGDQFGYCCALSNDGTTAIVGQPYDNNAGGADAGSAVVFTRSGKTWTEQAVLTYSAGAANDTFGYSVDLSSDGNTAICGVPADNPSGSSSGSAVVFTRSGSTWTQQAVLTFSGKNYFDSFGRSVSLSSDGNVVIIATPGSSFGSSFGIAVMFVRRDNVWNQQSVLSYSSGVAGDLFAWSVALSADSNVAIAGTPGIGADVGGAVIFYNH